MNQPTQTSKPIVKMPFKFDVQGAWTNYNEIACVRGKLIEGEIRLFDVIGLTIEDGSITPARIISLEVAYKQVRQVTSEQCNEFVNMVVRWPRQQKNVHITMGVATNDIEAPACP